MIQFTDKKYSIVCREGVSEENYSLAVSFTNDKCVRIDLERPFEIECDGNVPKKIKICHPLGLRKKKSKKHMPGS